MENDKIVRGPANSKNRSASYPSITVLDAYNFALKINDKFSNIEVTRKEMANVLKVHDSTISRDVAAVAAFGFFEKILTKGQPESKYKLTELFNDVFRYENEKQKKISLITAFGKPKLFSDLIAKFDGSVIPEELANTLIKHHGITEAASKEVADIFVRSGVEVGVINESRVLSYKVTLNATSKTQYAEIVDETKNNNSSNQGNQVNAVTRVETVNMPSIDDMKVPIHLTKNKMAYLLYPTDINEKDIKLLEHAINGILLRLNLENEDNVDKPVDKKNEE